MKHNVAKEFIDKESGVFYAPGSFFISTDYDRVSELNDAGFVEQNNEVESLKASKRTPRKKASDKDAEQD
ncbi:MULTISPECIES: hypothetical protein [Lysinibacillus]|uniref:hypothetical protein n=1 Tax=Lysinibacillus TaxID=400634 RepID=UPI00214B794D|nr:MULTISPECIES: hypothetical protein [Lysinibacillus]UUV23844.1 hypothetical protein NP781_18855 [Lysinibacillus sp. FN11]UYB46716.1 hypothetical protein OCI51_21465 [Lysinibacillus capsici]